MAIRQDDLGNVPMQLDKLGAAMSNVGETVGPMGQFKSNLQQILGSQGPGGLSPMELQMITGVPAMTPAGTAGINPFGKLGGGGGPAPGPGVGMPGDITAGNISAPTGVPSPAAEEQNLMDQESLRDHVAKLNNAHIKMNTMMELQGFKERLPVYDVNKLKFRIPYGQNVNRSRAMRAYNQSISDVLQAAYQSLTAMETAFGMGPDAAKTVIPDSYRKYLGNFPDDEAQLQELFSGRAKRVP